MRQFLKLRRTAGKLFIASGDLEHVRTLIAGPRSPLAALAEIARMLLVISAWAHAWARWALRIPVPCPSLSRPAGFNP